uniref:RING-type E3 ubiquitin transferase n=1 Tax=Alexandrium monilatum TaxID=311494 RepID=A0A7S4WGM4_9DINO
MPVPWSSRALLSSGLAAVGGAGAALLVTHLLRARRSVRGEDVDEESEELEALSSELALWLRSNGLHRHARDFAWHGYTELELLRDLSDEELVELVVAIGLRAGHAARLRRGISKLRAEGRAAAGDPGGPPAAPWATSPAPDGGPPWAAGGAEVAGGDAVPQPGGGAPRAAAPASPPAPAPGEAAVAEEAEASGAAAAVALPAPVPAPLGEPAPPHAAGPTAGSGAACTSAGSASSTGSGGSRAGPSPAAAPLSVGTRAVLCGLAKRPELNGCAGTLTAWDGASGRWEFTPEDGRGAIKVRSDNVQQIGPDAASAAAAVEVPEELRCCITREPMERPVITSDGHTYERAAIARWLEEHGTSPKTGQALPDKVLRPNHAIRAQVLAWRERRGLPPLPPWEPEPQETVPTREPPTPQVQAPAAGHPGATVTLQTAAGSVVLPLALLQGRPSVGSEAASVAQILRSNEALREEVLSVWREEAASGQAAGPDGPTEPETDELAQIVAQDPRLMEVVTQYLHSNPEAQPQVPGLVVGAAGGLGVPTLANHGVAEGPIFRAAREGECGVVEQLLGHRTGDRLRQEQSATGDSLLHVATWCGHGRIVSMLLARDHPIHVPSRNRSTPLHYAAFRGHADVVGLLLSSRADTERRMFGGDTAIHQAAWQGHVQVLGQLIEHRADVLAKKDDGGSALALAAFRGQVGACTELLARMTPDSTDLGGSNHHGETPLHAAAAGGSADVVKLLIEAAARVDARTDVEETALHRAVQFGASGAAAALLDARAEVGSRRDDDHTPLDLAVLEGRSGLARLLLQHGASVAELRRDGMTPVHMAVVREARAPRPAGEGSVLAVLVEARADPDCRSRSQLTPLHLVLGYLQQVPHRTNAIKSLLEQRADVEAVLRGGDRPLHLAVGGNLRVEAALLLEHRAAVNEARDDGCLPLHVAAQHGAGTCVELLLRARSDVSRQNQAGQTAADIARQCGLEHIERLLKRPSPATPAG